MGHLFCDGGLKFTNTWAMLTKVCGTEGVTCEHAGDSTFCDVLDASGTMHVMTGSVVGLVCACLDNASVWGHGLTL
jgi:hypothetical protein